MNLEERRTLATASDINLIRGQIEDAVALMIEELANINPEIKENPARIENAIKGIAEKISQEMVYYFGYDYGQPAYENKEEVEQVLIERLNKLAGL